MVKAAEFSIEIYAVQRADPKLVGECLGWLRHFFPMMLQAAEVHLPRTTGMQIVFGERAVALDLKRVLPAARPTKAENRLPEIRQRAS